jgi:ATP-dependent Clp protease ATP-binding subunit ClpB
MRFDKFTIKSQELIQSAQSLASQHNNQQIEPEHLLAAMLAEGEGIAGAMLRKLGAAPHEIAEQVTAAIARIPGVSGEATGETYISPRARAVLEQAFSEATNMKDEYVSIEHILLAISDEKNGEAAVILAGAGVTREAILKVLLEIRGNQRITDPNPEEKYQALEKFSRDLTDLARLGKLPSSKGWPSELWKVMSPKL